MDFLNIKVKTLIKIWIIGSIVSLISMTLFLLIGGFGVALLFWGLITFYTVFWAAKRYELIEYSLRVSNTLKLTLLSVVAYYLATAGVFYVVTTLLWFL